MKKKIADRWVRALRSGNYKQGKQSLVLSDGSFCCLGVLCDLATKSKVVSPDNYSHLGVLSDEVQEWAGMQSDSGDRKNRKSLTEYNDHCGYSFNKIADIIEKNYKDF